MARAGEKFRWWVTEPSTVVAAILLVIGLVFVGLESQSQNWVYYTGQHVTGTVQGGIVFYKVAGETYTQDDTSVPTPPDGTQVKVYFHRGDPSEGLLDRPVRWIEELAMAFWFVAAALLLVLGAARRSWKVRRRPYPDEDAHWWPTGHGAGG